MWALLVYTESKRRARQNRRRSHGTKKGVRNSIRNCSIFLTSTCTEQSAAAIFMDGRRKVSPSAA